MKIYNIDGPNERVYEHTCENGFKVFLWPYKETKEVSLSLTVRYGSIHTNFVVNNQNIKVPNGMAHFLEHIKFNEDSKTTAHDFFHKEGSYVNAYTTYDNTSYEVVCDKNMEENLKHLLYFVFNPFFDKKSIEKEKPIIVEESKMVIDNPYNIGYQKLLNNLYYKSNRKYLITGNEKDINSIGKDDAVNVFNAFYKPNNMFLVVTGKINIKKIVSIVDKFMKDIPASNEMATIKYPKEKDEVVKEYEEISVGVTSPKVFVTYKIPKNVISITDDVKLKTILNLILEMNFGPTSDFNDYLTENKLADDLYTSASLEEEHIIINCEVSTSNPKKVIKLVENEFDNLKINENDFKRKLKTFIVSSIKGYEDAYAVNSLTRHDIISYHRIIDNYPTILKSLSIEDLNGVKEEIKNYQRTVLVLNPKDKKE